MPAPKHRPATAEITDGDLARTIASSPSGGAVEAEAELYRRFAARVRFFGLRHLRDEAAAQDLAHQVLLVTVQRLRAGTVREPDQLGSFILGTSRMVAQAQQRREWRRAEILAEYAHLMSAAEEPDQPSVDASQLEECLQRLGERERTILVQTFYAEQSATIIAETLAMSAGAVRVARHRALARMRECLELRSHV